MNNELDGPIEIDFIPKRTTLCSLSFWLAIGTIVGALGIFFWLDRRLRSVEAKLATANSRPGAVATDNHTLAAHLAPDRPGKELGNNPSPGGLQSSNDLSIERANPRLPASVESGVARRSPKRKKTRVAKPRASGNKINGAVKPNTRSENRENGGRVVVPAPAPAQPISTPSVRPY